MSIYDEVTFKSKKELDTQKLPLYNTGENQKYKDQDFIEVFNNVKTSELKNMMYLDNDDSKKFDYFINKQEYVDQDFFTKSKVFSSKMNEQNKIDYLLDYLENTYGVVTPKNLRTIFEEFLGMGQTGLSNEDYENIIEFNFNKLQINLKDSRDRSSFKEFLISSLESEKKEVDVFPKARVSNVEVKNSQESNSNMINLR
jgi:hypothetical protein